MRILVVTALLVSLCAAKVIKHGAKESHLGKETLRCAQDNKIFTMQFAHGNPVYKWNNDIEPYQKFLVCVLTTVNNPNDSSVDEIVKGLAESGLSTEEDARALVDKCVRKSKKEGLLTEGVLHFFHCLMDVIISRVAIMGEHFKQNLTSSIV